MLDGTRFLWTALNQNCENANAATILLHIYSFQYRGHPKRHLFPILVSINKIETMQKPKVSIKSNSAKNIYIFRCNKRYVNVAKTYENIFLLSYVCAVTGCYTCKCLFSVVSIVKDIKRFQSHKRWN